MNGGGNRFRREARALQDMALTELRKNLSYTQCLKLCEKHEDKRPGRRREEFAAIVFELEFYGASV